MTPADALQKAKDIAGPTREIQGRFYIDNADKAHEKLDNLLLDLLKDDYPDLVEFFKKLRLWYG